MTADIQRVLKDQIRTRIRRTKRKNQTIPEEQPEPTTSYGDPSKRREGRSGVDLIIGTDHGAGSSRILCKTNLLDSEKRRAAGNIEFGSRLIQIGNIICKKDTEEILKQVAPAMQKMKKRLENGKIVGMMDEKKRNRNVFFAQECTTLSHCKTSQRWQ